MPTYGGVTLPWILVIVLGCTTASLVWAVWTIKLELRTRWREVGRLERGPRFAHRLATSRSRA